ncbi:hypothetical protein IAT38_000185 [Cryptococcus sp. DSM 104549]
MQPGLDVAQGSLHAIDVSTQSAKLRRVAMVHDLTLRTEESVERMNVAFEERMVRVERDVREGDEELGDDDDVGYVGGSGED